MFSYQNYPQISWEMLQNKKILLTGVSGMIGTALCDLIADYNRQGGNICVIGVSRNEKAAKQQLGSLMEQSWFTYVASDINEKLPELGNIDYIIHGASNTHPRAYANDPIGTITANVIGTKNLLDYAVTHHCERFVFLSSVEIYGENKGDTELFAEDYLGYIDCNTMRSGYPESKRVGESLCNAYKVQKGLDFVIPRLSRVYGPTMLQSDSKALSQFIRKAAAREDIVLKSKGEQLYSYTFVEDCAAAILFLLQKGESGQAYNVTGKGEAITLAHLAEILAQCAGTKVVFELPDAVEQAGYSTATKAVLDGNKLQKLGFEPRISMEQGLAFTVEKLKEASGTL